MKDCSKEIRKFHNDRVTLPEKTQAELRSRRNANQKRLKAGLKKAGDPDPQKFVKQGSYAHRTMVQDQHGDNDFDIDDGVVFFREDLKGKQGGDKTAYDARKMVCDAIGNGFKTPPEILKNCVRVYYDEGYHIDIPVYRNEDNSDTEYELASSDWRVSNPEGVNKWFDVRLSNKYPAGDGGRQMRRMIRILKFWGKSRKSWNMPSGFIWSVLVDEVYTTFDDREDRALHNVMKAIRDRLRINKIVSHPVVEGKALTKGTDDLRMVECEQRLTDALETLSVLFSASCDKSDALKAWKKVFNTDFFDKEIEKAEKKEKEKAAACVAGIAAAPRQYCP